MAVSNHPTELYPIRDVPLSRPFVWLSKAWEDLWHHRAASLAYGILVSSLGALMLAYAGHPFFLAAISSGFLLVGPIMTAGLCELSRCRDHGEPANFQTSLLALSKNRTNLLRFAEVLLVLGIAWFGLSGIILQSMLGAAGPSLESTVWGDVMRQLSQAQLMAYIVAGGTLAVLVFALSVVTVPMIIDRHVNAGTAMRTSLRVTLRDLPALLVWAVIIVALVAVGFATSLLAMIFIFPLLGHATWHAYHELIVE
jgi:uncharacterized membrane protein